MITATEILNDLRNGKQPKPLAQWVEALSQRETSAIELARVKTLSQAQSTALTALATANDSSAVAKILASSLTDTQWSFGRDAIPLYLSTIVLLQNPKLKPDSKFLATLSTFEQAQFDHLPDWARLDIFKNRLLALVQKINLVAELQAIYQVEAFWDDGTWIKSYQQALLTNQEVLGKQQLTLDNAQAAPTVGNWLRDFITTLPQQPGGAPGVYDQVHYLSGSPLVAGLSDPEKSLLSNVLRVYSWLTDPIVNEVELAAYETAKSAALDQSLGLEPSVKRPITIPQAVSDNNVVEKPVASLPAQLSSKPANRNTPTINMQDILNRRGQGGGIVYDNETNVKVEEIGQRLEAERQQQQSEIDKKLQALKKRGPSQ
jgi:hypothetical protein